MLGMADGWVAAGLILSIASTLFCMIYGFARWNQGDETITVKDREWAKDEEKIEDSL